MKSKKKNARTAKRTSGYLSLGYKLVAVAMSVVMFGFGWPAVSIAETVAADATQGQDAASDDAAITSSAAKDADSASGDAAQSEDSAGSSDASDEDGAPSSADVALDLGHAYIVSGGQNITYPASKVTVPTSKDFAFTAAADNGYALTDVVLTVSGKESSLSAGDDDAYTVGKADLAAGASIKLVTDKQSTSSAKGNAAVSIASLDSDQQSSKSSSAGKKAKSSSAEYSISGPAEVTMGESITLTYNGAGKATGWYSNTHDQPVASEDGQSATLSISADYSASFNGVSKDYTVSCSYVDADGKAHANDEALTYTVTVKKRSFYVQDPPAMQPGDNHFWTPVLVDSDTNEVIDSSVLDVNSLSIEYYRDGVKLNASQYYHNDADFTQDGVYTVVVKAYDGSVYASSTDSTVEIPDEKGIDTDTVKYVYVGESVSLSGGDGWNDKWSISDSAVASLSGSGSSASVTGLKAGTATVTHTYLSGWGWFPQTNTDTFTIHVLKKPALKDLVISGDDERSEEAHV